MYIIFVIDFVSVTKCALSRYCDIIQSNMEDNHFFLECGN